MTESKPEANPVCKHWLIVYNRKSGELKRCEEFSDGNEALAERFALEREHRLNTYLEIVVLSARSLDNLKRTHGRYFYTLAELAERIRS